MFGGGLFGVGMGIWDIIDYNISLININNGKFRLTQEISERATPLAEEELASGLYDLVSQCASLKQIKKGANEATKTLNRGITELIIIAADANPLEIVLHLPILCEEKVTLSLIQNIPYVFVQSKKALGTACGTARNVICVSILKNKTSKANDSIKEIVNQCERLFVSG